LPGDAFAAGPIRDNVAEHHGDNAATQRRPQRNDPAQETSAQISAGQCSDWTHGLSSFYSRFILGLL